MTTPNVEVRILQNSLGIQTPTDGDVLAIIGPADDGALNTPGLYGRTRAAQADFVGGPLVEAAALAIEVGRRPVVLVRADTTTAGAIGSLTLNMDGTAIPVAAQGSAPNDDYEVYVEFISGGTVGTDGITYQWSLDGGRTMSPLVALGTDVVIAIPNSLTSFFLDPVEAGLVALVNDLRTDMLAHFILTTGTVHLASDTTSDDGIGSAATSLATALTLVNSLRTALIAHAANLTAHTIADTAITALLLPAAALNAQEAVSLANALKSAYNTHRVKLTGTIHGGSGDTTNVTAATDASPGTILAGDSFSAATTAPLWNTAQLDAALEKLQRSSLQWDVCLILGPVTSTNQANSIGTRITAMEAAYKYKRFFCNFRIPNAGETEAAYLTAYKAAFDAVTIHEISMAAGSQEFESAASRPRRYRRPPSWMAAVDCIVLGPHVDLAYVNDGAGALPLGATITDSTGNPKHHDEDLDGGLDTARALTLRSVPGYPGKVFITNPRTLAQLGTDFVWVQLWGVMCKVLDAAIPKLIGQLSAGIESDPATGKVLDAAAKDLEQNVLEEVENKVLSKGWASSANVAIDRTTNILTSPVILVDVSVVPLAYIKKFILTVALKTPAFVNS